MAQFCNSVIGYKLLQPGHRIYRYTTARAFGPPTRSLKEGLRHNIGTLSDAVNFAYCMGWKEIVLVGVDLYDSRYFWLKPDETLGLNKETGMLEPAKIHVRGWHYNQPHNTAHNGMIENMKTWREVFAREEVLLSVYNPRSLLAAVVPVYSWERDCEKFSPT